jgi:predicted RNA methylase
MAALTTGNLNDALSARGDDCYETPPEAVQALLRVERLPKRIWEPCCGPGSIARTLRSRGHEVLATDLVDYQSPDQDHARRDFLMELSAPEGFDCIVTNPPFKLGAEFVGHALELVRRVYMLLRYAFMESASRADILDCGRLKRVYLFANRLAMMHRHGWDRKQTSSAMAFAWFCWDRERGGPTITKRIFWKPERRCLGCDSPFTARRADARTCSPKCRQRIRRHRITDSAAGRQLSVTSQTILDAG